MRAVSKAQFEAAYFEYGRETGGWTRAYWDRFYADDRTPPMTYKLELPQGHDQTRMMIVDDYALREHRLFFISEEAEERLFGSV